MSNDLDSVSPCKIMLLGDSGVGKSAILERAFEDKFDE